MKRASIIGLGNILKGDYGIGCYVLDALGQEPLGDSIEMAYLAENSSYVDAYIHGVDFAVIIQAFPLGGRPGSIYRWDAAMFLRNRAWLAESSPTVSRLARALARREFLDGSYGDVLFLWIEPKTTEGFGISREMHTAMRRAIQIVRRNLFKRGFLPETIFNLSFIHQLILLDAMV